MTHIHPLRLALLALLTAPMMASAVKFDVNVTQDKPDATPGDGICSYSSTLDPQKFSVCTLRAAMMEGNTVPTAQSVEIRLKSGALYRFTIPEPNNHDLDGRGGDLRVKRQMKIAASPETPRATIDANGLSRVFHVTAPGTSIENVTLKGGLADDGAAILAFSPMQLVRADVHSNFRRPDAVGVTYAIDGNVSLFDTTVHMNGTPSQPVGGLLTTWADQAVVVDGSTINHNTSDGIDTQSGALILQNSTVSSNQGQGIGAINSDVGIAFSTIFNNAQAQIGFSTLLDDPDVTLMIIGSIIDANGNQDACSILGDKPFLTAWNIYSDDSCLSDIFFDNSLHNRPGTVKSSLSNAGGLTSVHLPIANSPAVDRAPSAICANLGGADQRGFPRPVSANGMSPARCDIGAVEVQQ